MRKLAKTLVVMMLFVVAAGLTAQTSYEVKEGTVVSVFGDQLVVKMSTGETKEITVPAGFKFTVDGRQVGLADLTPGTKLSATIKTTKTPETVKVVTVKNGEVIRVAGSTLYVRTDGVYKAIKVPKGFKFQVDGRQADLQELRPGMNLTAEIVTSSEKTVTERDVQVSGNTPPPPPAPVAHTPAAEPAPAPAEAEAAPVKLPKTASPVPLFGLMGMLLTAAGIAVRRRSA